MAVPPEFLEDLRQRIPLSDIIGKRVKLTRRGRRHSGLCPFHSEKTPSFSVVDAMGLLGPDMSRMRIRHAIAILGGVSKKAGKRLEKEYGALPSTEA